MSTDYTIIPKDASLLVSTHARFPNGNLLSSVLPCLLRFRFHRIREVCTMSLLIVALIASTPTNICINPLTYLLGTLLLPCFSGVPLHPDGLTLLVLVGEALYSWHLYKPPYFFLFLFRVLAPFFPAAT